MANARNPSANRGRSKTERLYDTAYFSASYSSDLEQRLSQLERDVVEKVARSSARAGALVIYDEIKIRATLFKEPTNTMYNAVYHWFDTKRSTETRKTYMVGINKRKAPHWHNVEYGHWRINVVFTDENTGALIALRKRLAAPKWVPAHPFLRPAWDAKRDDALRAMAVRASQRIDELARGEQ